MKLLVLIVVLINVSNSCNISGEKYPYDEDSLTYKNQFVFKNQFKMEGVYITEYSDFFGVNYFWENGVFFQMGSENSISVDECFSFHEENRNIPYYWGYFIIEDNILKVQTYDPGSLNRYSEFKVEERWATIVNDSTIHFFKKITPWGEEKIMDETLNFHQCDNKPDSTNLLMD